MKLLRFLIVGLTDNQVLIWDVESQPNRHAVLGATNSRPDLVNFIVKSFYLFMKCQSPLIKTNPFQVQFKKRMIFTLYLSSED